MQRQKLANSLNTNISNRILKWLKKEVRISSGGSVEEQSMFGSYKRIFKTTGGGYIEGGG